MWSFQVSPISDLTGAALRPAEEIDQAVRLLPRGLVNSVELAGDHQPPRPAVPAVGELPGLPVDPGVRASTAPDLDGSITKHTVSGPMNTRSQHFAGPSPSRGANTRHVVSSACNTRSFAFSARSRPIFQRGSQRAVPGRRLSTLRIQDRASRNHHAAQQTPSGTADHASHPERVTVRRPPDASSPVTGFPSTYERGGFLTIGPAGTPGRDEVSWARLLSC